MPEYSGQRSLSIGKRFGARPQGIAWLVNDARRVDDGEIGASSNDFHTDAGGLATHASGVDYYVGKPIAIRGAGTGGRLFWSTIDAVVDDNNAVLADAAATTVTAAKSAWGTDNASRFDAMRDAIEGGGNAPFIDGGMYLISGSHEITGNFKMYGPCSRLDLAHTQGQTGRYACFLCTGNKAFTVSPYPGVEIRDIIFEGIDTDTDVETYEQAVYSEQIGIWLGYTGTPLTLPTDDYGAGPGSGGATFKGCTFSGFSGWGTYAYKLYGKSFFDRCRWYQNGVLPDSATEEEIDRHGGAYFNSESVDFELTSCHFIGPFSGTDRGGTALKLGAKSTDAAAMNRFYLGTSHASVQNCLIEGKWHRGSADYFAIASKFDGVVYGDVRELIIGENPFVSSLNRTGWYRNIDLSGADIVVKVYAERIVLDGFLSETPAAKTIRYWYPGPIIKNCKNMILEPSGDKSAIVRNSELWDNRPLAFTDLPNDGVNLLPNYHTTGAWTLSSSPEATLFDRWKLKLYDSATASTTITDLTPGQVYTFGFFCSVVASFAEMVTYRLEDGSAVEILANQIGETAVDILDTEFYLMMNFVAPVDGEVTVIFKNDSPNQVEFNAPWIVQGFADKFIHGGYEFEGNPNTGAVTGRAVDAAGEWEYFDTIMSRKFGGFAANLTARKQSLVGLGANIHNDGTEWVTGHDATNNGGGAVLVNPTDGSMGLYAVPTTGTGQPRKIDDAALSALLRVLVETNDRLVQYGTAGAEQNIAQRKRGTAASPTNVEYRLSQRANGEDWMIIGYDGSASWLVLETDYSTQKVYVNGVDVTALFPAGADAGEFLRSDGGTAKSWQKVDYGDATNVKGTGLTVGQPAVKHADGHLISAKVNVSDSNMIAVAGLVDGEIVRRSGAALASLSISSLISALFADPGWEAALKSLLDHTHDYEDVSNDATTGPAPPSDHTHAVGSSGATKTSDPPNW